MGHNGWTFGRIPKRRKGVKIIKKNETKRRKLRKRKVKITRRKWETKR
jgi:hypothetical protein